MEGFRESAKSSICIRAHSLHRLVYSSDMSYFVFILSNQRRASQKLTEIVEEFKSHPVLSIFLNEIYRSNDTCFEALVGEEKRRVRLEAYGKGASIRGLNWMDHRPDMVVIDDPQDPDDAMSELICERDWNWFLSDVNFLGRDSRIFVIGNNLGSRCLVERIYNASEALNFRRYRIPILDEEGKPTWPGRFSSESIEKERQAFSSVGKLDVWYREKMCIPVSPESQRFTESMFRYYDYSDVPEDLACFTTVDLAISQSDKADYTAITTVGVSPEGAWYVLDCDYGRYDPTETMDHIFRAVRRYGPVKVGIEKVAYQAALLHFLEKEMPRQHTFFVIEPLVSATKKELRIEAVQPRFSQGMVWFPSGASWLREMEGELLSFPYSEHDDLIDSLAYIDQVAFPPSAWKRKANGGSVIPKAGSL